MKKLLITVLFFAMPALCFAQAGDKAAEATKNIENICKRRSSIIARAFDLNLAKTPQKEICAIVGKEYNYTVTESACAALVDTVKEVHEKDDKIMAPKVEALYFIACTTKLEKERLAKKPKRSEDIGRPAIQKDMPGAYYLVQAPEAIDKLRNTAPDPFDEKYQWYIFHEDGRFDYFSSSKDIGGIKSRKDVQELIDTIRKLPGAQPPTYYRFLKEGFLVLHAKEEPDFGTLWGVNLILNRYDTGKGIVWEQGDILLSLDQDGKPVYHKQLRRLKD